MFLCALKIAVGVALLLICAGAALAILCGGDDWDDDRGKGE